MYYEPQILDKYLKNSLRRLNEDDCRAAIELLRQRIADLNDADYYLRIQIEDLMVSTRAYNALLHHKLETVGDILEYGLERLGQVRDIGLKTLDEINVMIKNIIAKKDKIRGLTGTDLGRVLTEQ